ncbi:hypothetical protein NIES2107_12140 [Nostoc carneum NIES-2107]|nr:hypothetical protein NIES2107_12140 [Nostoc carneum NIES-2107]
MAIAYPSVEYSIFNVNPITRVGAQYFVPLQLSRPDYFELLLHFYLVKSDITIEKIRGAVIECGIDTTTLIG